MRINYICLLLIMTGLPGCSQSNQKNITDSLTVKGQSRVVTVKNHSAKEWKELLTKFPNRSMDFLLQINKFDYLKDSISRHIIDDFFWNNTYNDMNTNPSQYPQTIIENKFISYPIGGMPPLDSKGDSCEFKSGKGGLFPHRVYPIGQIPLKNSLTMVLYSYPQPYEEFYFVTAFVLDSVYNKVGRMGFMYSARWKHCDDTIEEIMKNSEPLSSPTKLHKNGFTLKDKMVAN